MAQLQSTSITGTFKIGCTPDSGSTGNLWFDINKNTFAIAKQVKSWSAVASTIRCRPNQSAGAGDQNAGLAIGGTTYAPIYAEEFNGTSWSEGGNLSIGRCFTANGGAGTQNAALAVAGNPSGATEEYNGTSWATGGSFSCSGVGAGGSQNDAIGILCYNIVCEYNGTSWSTGVSIPSRSSPICDAFGAPAAGPSTSNIIANTSTVYPTSVSTNQIQSFNGTSWSIEGSYNRNPQGTNINGEAYTMNLGGSPPAAVLMTKGITEEYDGTSWSNQGNNVLAYSAIACDAGAAGYNMLSWGGSFLSYSRLASEYGGLTGIVKYIG